MSRMPEGGSAGLTEKRIRQSGLVGYFNSRVPQENLSLVRALLDHGAHVNYRDEDGWTPLKAALCCNKVATVRLLIEHGANVQPRSGFGSTVLQEATENRDVGIDTIAYLLDHCKDVN